MERRKRDSLNHFGCEKREGGFPPLPSWSRDGASDSTIFLIFENLVHPVFIIPDKGGDLRLFFFSFTGIHAADRVKLPTKK